MEERKGGIPKLLRMERKETGGGNGTVKIGDTR